MYGIGLKLKTRQTPRWQRQASLLASTAAKNRSWPAPTQMCLPCRSNGSDMLVCGSKSRLGLGLGLGKYFFILLDCFLCCVYDFLTCLFVCLFLFCLLFLTFCAF